MIGLSALLVVAAAIYSFTVLTGPEVPQQVLAAFAEKFPDATKVEWEVESDNEYEAEFKRNKQEFSANFRADGTWLETETEIKKKDLPAAVQQAVATQFPGYEIEEAERVETPTEAEAYEVELEKKKSEIEALFRADGTLLQQSSGEEADEDND